MTKWWRENKWAAAIVTVIRIIVGWEWLTAGYHKLTDGFSAEAYLGNAVNNPVMDKATGELVYPTFTAFLEIFALPNVKIINTMIPLGEFLVGLGLILGALTAAAAFFGIMMNFMFMFAGTVSTNPWLMLLGIIVFIAGANGGRYGLDHFVTPLLRKWYTNIRHPKPNTPKINNTL